MRKETIEGDVKILIDDKGKISKELEVFYNPKMSLNRTMSVCVLRAMERNDLQIALPLAGTGVRGIRLLKELPKEQIKELKLNDINDKSKEFFKKNCELNSFSKEELEKVSFQTTDANLFLLQSKGFDYIDIDPFGSPNFLLQSAISRISRGGILAVTATDTAPLSGTFPDTCKQKYWSESALSPQKHEMAIRILIRKVQLIGMQNEKALYPIISYHYEHYYKIFFRVEKGRKKAQELYELNNSFFHYCPHCSLSFTKKTRIDLCPECKIKLNVAGPLYSGKIHETEFLKKMEKHLTQRKTIFGDDEKNILRLVQNAIKENELDIVGSFDTHSIAKKRNKKIGRVKDHIECLRNKGFEAVQSQLPFTGIKTNASFDEFLECFEDEE